MNISSEPDEMRDCRAKQHKPWIVGMAMQLGLTYVNVRSAIFVMALTYASAGKDGLIFVLFCSVVYSGTILAVRRWGRISADTASFWLLCINGIPGFLVLGIIALIVKVFYEQSEIEPKAYPLRVLITICALLQLFHFTEFISKSFLAWRKRGIVESQRDGEIWSDATYAHPRCTNVWKDLNELARFWLITSYVLNSVLWTWLVIYYRHYCYSFLGHSLWVMVSLWIFLASCWFGCVALFICVGAPATAMRNVLQPPTVSRCDKPAPIDRPEASSTLIARLLELLSRQKRFRANTSLLPWLLTGIVCVYAFDVFRGRSFYPLWRVSFATVLMLSVLLFLLNHFLTYWELDKTSLRQRKLWKKKEIAWRDVTRVGKLGFTGKDVMISYGRVPEDCGYILVNPCNRGRFLSALRRFAPQAEFDDSIDRSGGRVL